MNGFSQALGTKFNKDALRIRTFEYNGHTFKVKVPLTIEADAITMRTKNLDENKLNQFYETLSKEFIVNKDEIIKTEQEIEYTENDVIVKGRSLREAAKNKLLFETRITEMFKLLVPEEQGFDMDTITYDMIEELFPFSIQMELLQLINDTISPSYKETKGN
jgi:6-pyruvoyl-tetrahydropterin synthase